MLEELQSLSETKKKQVLIIATIIIMAIVIGIWITYFNSIVVGAARQAAPANASTTIPAPTAPAGVVGDQVSPNAPGLWQNIENGFDWFANIFRKPSQYTIQPN